MKKLFENKFVTLCLILILSLVLLASCTSKTSTTASTKPPATSAAPTTTTTTTKPPVTSVSLTTSVSSTTTSAAPTAASVLPSTVWGPLTPPQKLGGSFVWSSNLGIPTMGAPIDAPTSYSLIHPMFEALVRTDENEKLFPWLAESWTVAPDGKSITFNLRKGVKFHDGTNFDAEAVKYNLQQVLAANLSGTDVLKKITSYDIIDANTIRLNLTSFDYTLLLRLGQSIIGLMASPTAMQNGKTPQERAIGTGPFKFDSWARDNFVKAVKNPNYWQKGKPYLDSITYKCITDVTVAIMSFKAKEIDLEQNIDPVDAKQLQSEGFKVEQSGVTWIHSLIPDGGNPKSPFADIKVRQALEYAIDKKGHADGVGMGAYTTLYQVAMPGDAYYDASLQQREYNVAKAKQLLTEAGYPSGLKIKLVTDVRVRKDSLQAVQTYLKEAGFDVTTDIADVARITSLQRSGWEGILYPGFPQPDNLLNYLTRWGDPTNFVSFYRPAGWQGMWDQLAIQSDDTTRSTQLKAIVKLIYDQSIAIPFHGDRPYRVYRPGVVNNFAFHTNRTSGWFESADIWVNK
jgi:peptide/nickel transport system substrate-binding protein